MGTESVSRMQELTGRAPQNSRGTVQPLRSGEKLLWEVPGEARTGGSCHCWANAGKDRTTVPPPHSQSPSERLPRVREQRRKGHLEQKHVVGTPRPWGEAAAGVRGQASTF